MAARLAPRSLVLRRHLRLGGRAVCAVLGLLLATAGPGWAFTPVALADIGPQTLFAVGGIPTGGYLLVWQDARRSDFAVLAQRFTAAGRPLGPVKALDVGPAHDQLSVFSVAVGETGAWGVFWVEGAGADQVGIGGALFDAHDRLLKRLSFPDPVPDPGGLVISYNPRAVALPGGGFWLASEVGTQDDPTEDPLRPSRTDVYVRRLDAAGQTVGAAVRANEATTGFHRLTGVGGSRDHVVVSWDAISGELETRAVRARFFAGTLAPAGPEVHVAEPDGSAGGAGGSRLAVGADGRALLAWQGSVAGPDGAPPSLGVRLRAFGPHGEPRGAERAADPGTPGDHVLSDLGLTSEGTVWVSWTTLGPIAPSGDVYENALSLRPFDLAGEPLGGAEDAGVTTVADGPFVIGGRGGALVAWRPSSSSPFLLGFVVGPAGGESGPPSAPFAIESPGLPGFRAWVRFDPPFNAPLWGTPVEPCLAEALCAAAVLPARAEVVVRLIGPRANGFLWPQIVRFTTDPVEVWVQQKTTGAIRYYLLPAGSPGTDTLTGRFDRFGFRP